MTRAEFLDILNEQLSGQMHEGKVAAHLRYYQDYIQSQVRKGRSEREVLEELGDPRLIAKTLIETDVDSGDFSYEEYSTGSGYPGEATRASGHSFHLDLGTWYGKLIVIAGAAVCLALLILIIGAIVPFFLVLAVIVFLLSVFKKRRP